VRAQYDHGGRRTRLTWPDGFFVSYDYRVTGEMAAIRENGGAVLASFSYDELGRRASIARGNGTVTTYGYDAGLAAGVADAGARRADNDGVTATFRYNPAMQIASETRSNDRYQWSGGGNGTTASTPNALNQIGAHNGVAFSYDAKGNLDLGRHAQLRLHRGEPPRLGPRHQPLLRPARPARAPLRATHRLPL
jgi:hypothetical protein